MHGVALRFVLLLCFSSSVAVNSGRVRDGMSTLAPFVMDPGAVSGASPSMHGLVTPVMMERTCAIGWRSWELPPILVCPSSECWSSAMLRRWLRRFAASCEACHLWRLAPGIAFKMSLRRRLPLLVLPHVGPWRLIGSCTCSSPVTHASSLQGCRIWYGNAIDLLRVSLDWYLSLRVSLMMVPGTSLIP